MSAILQGTTPKLEITVPESVPLDSVTGIELTMKHRGQKMIYGMSDVDVDTEANTITYSFTEAQTMAMDPRQDLIWQLRLKNATGIVGTLPAAIRVYDLISEVLMG